MLDADELEILMPKILAEIKNHVYLSNRNEQLGEYLDSINVGYLLQSDENQASEEDVINPNYKIAIIGQAQISKSVIEAIAGDYNFPPERLELCLEYDKLVNYNFCKLHNTYDYGAIFVAAMPHKTVGTGNYASAIDMMMNEQGYPKVYKLGGNDLKLTKNSLNATFELYSNDLRNRINA